MLRNDEMYRRIGCVDIAPLQHQAHLLEFEDSGGVCAQVSKAGTGPPELLFLLANLHLGGTPYRQFCRKLRPHQGIPPHTDSWIKERELGVRRFQVPVISHPDIKMRWPDDGVEVHLEPGYLYEVRVDRKHEVVNNVDAERIHIQIDQIDATI